MKKPPDWIDWIVGLILGPILFITAFTFVWLAICFTKWEYQPVSFAVVRLMGVIGFVYALLVLTKDWRKYRNDS